MLSVRAEVFGELISASEIELVLRYGNPFSVSDCGRNASLVSAYGAVDSDWFSETYSAFYRGVEDPIVICGAIDYSGNVFGELLAKGYSGPDIP